MTVTSAYAWFLQGYYRVRQTAEQLRKKKEDEREARQRERDAAEKAVEAETKSKTEEITTEKTKETEKVCLCTRFQILFTWVKWIGVHDCFISRHLM